MSSTAIKTFGDLRCGDRFCDKSGDPHGSGAIYTVADLARENGRTQVTQHVQYDGYSGPLFQRAWANDSDKIDAWRIA